MAGVSKGLVPPAVAPESRFNSITLGESLQLTSQVETHVEPYELVELFYGSHAVTSKEQEPLPAPHSPHSPPQVIELLQRTKATPNLYKCEACGRMFKEASHFSKHKRGALCRKAALKLTKSKNKKNKEKGNIEKRGRPPNAPYKPYQCKLCGSRFFDKVNVELHLERTHQTRQPLWLEVTKSGGFGCSECDLWFSDRIQLKQHQQHHQHSTPNPPTTLNENLIQTPLPPQHHIPGPQYYFQPIQQMPNFTTTHNSHQFAHPPPQTLHQVLPPLPPQSHPVHTFVTPHSNVNPGINNNMPLPPLVPNNCLDASHVPISASNSLPSSNAVNDNGSLRNTRGQKLERNLNSSRWNVCGECGQKFVDPINLELHMQRKHPESTIIETVELNGGFTLYRTNNPNRNGVVQEEIQSDDSSNNAKAINNNQSYDCALCGYKTPSMPNIVNHLQRIHNTSNANFIVVLDFTESKGNKIGKFSKKNNSDATIKEENKHKCISCSKMFKSKAELIRHRVKDKTILCGICNYSSCSDSHVAFHMYSTHRSASSNCVYGNKSTNFLEQTHNNMQIVPPDLSLTEIVSNESETMLNVQSQSPANCKEDGFYPSRLLCCICNFFATSGVSLAQHLESHGSIHVQCGKCEESSNSFIAINSHIISSHNNEVTRVTLTMKTSSHTPSVYMFLITPSNFSTSRINNNNHSNKTVDSCSLDKINTSEKQNLEESSLNPQTTPIYACSDCGACLTGSSELEAHLVLHQTSSSRIDSLSRSTNSDVPINCQNALTVPYNSPLSHTQNTIQFRCEECGFWREESESVIRHVQTVHMSGNMVHSQKQPSGQVKNLTIHVFTPLSALVSS